MALPDGKRLRELERRSRLLGSGLTAADLVGDWALREVWARDNSSPSTANSTLLRALAASLLIEEGADGQLTLCNSVYLGPLRITFTGPGRLQQKRPLLMFQFLRIQVSLAGLVLFSAPLAVRTSRQEPFFALIARDRTDEGSTWLAARGRGGGLALWVQEDDQWAG